MILYRYFSDFEERIPRSEMEQHEVFDFVCILCYFEQFIHSSR